MADTSGQKQISRKDDSAIQDLEKLFSQVKSPRSKLEPDWYLNVAYFDGNQWVRWNNGRIDKPQIPDYRIQLVDNRILPAAFARIARKVKNRPVFSVTPNSYGEDDLNAAEIGEKVLEDDWSSLNLQTKLFEVLMWAEVCTAGFWKIYWDSTKGNSSTSYVIDPAGKVFLNPNDNRPMRADSKEGQTVLGVEGFTSKVVAMGDVQVDVVSPFSFYPDPIAETVEDCEFIIEEHVRSVEYVKKHYGVDVEADTDIPAGIAESRGFQFLNGGSSTSEYKGVTVKELTAQSGSKYGSEGKRCVWAKNQVLKEETLAQSPYSDSPYVMFSGIKVPGRFWPTCVTTQLRGPQTELNKKKSQISENATRFGNPSILLSRQANTAYYGVPGEQIFYDSTTPDAKPEFLYPAEMPGYVQQEIETIQQSITEISGLHEVSNASVPSGVTAASAINLLQEADQTRLGPEIQDLELNLGKGGTKILKLRAKYQTDERLIRSAGEDGDWDIEAYRNTMSKDNTNVEVQAGSQMPKSTAGKQATMTELFQTMLQYGVEFKPRDLRKFFREYGVGGLDSMFAGLTNDEMQIKREHNIMKSGAAIDINEFDDDDLHIEGHEELLKTKWCYNHPEIQKLVQAHVNAHKERRTMVIQQQVQEQQRAMQAMNGGSGATQ